MKINWVCLPLRSSVSSGTVRRLALEERAVGGI